MAIWGRNHPFKGKFTEFFYTEIQQMFLHDFCAEFHAHLSHYKQKHCTRYKSPSFSPPLRTPSTQGTKILTWDIRVRRTFACKTLS